jgi:hypothetical protein
MLVLMVLYTMTSLWILEPWCPGGLWELGMASEIVALSNKCRKTKPKIPVD